MDKVKILELVSKESDYELYELKDGRVLKLDKHNTGKEIFDSVDSAFDILKECYRENVDEMLSNNEEAFSKEAVKLHRIFLNDKEREDVIKIYKIMEGVSARNGNRLGFDKLKSAVEIYKE